MATAAASWLRPASAWPKLKRGNRSWTAWRGLVRLDCLWLHIVWLHVGHKTAAIGEREWGGRHWLSCPAAALTSEIFDIIKFWYKSITIRHSNSGHLVSPRTPSSCGPMCAPSQSGHPSCLSLGSSCGVSGRVTLGALFVYFVTDQRALLAVLRRRQ